MTDLYDIPLTRIGGSSTSLAEFRGNVLLIVNTASECGFTPQYSGLESLYKKYRDQGLVVLGFPCNQFGGQEPGSDAQIAEFCEKRFEVSFPMFAKVDVNGPQAHPLFVELKRKVPGLLGTEGIKWNFTKFLVDRKGKVISRFGSVTPPDKLEQDVVRALDDC